MLVVSENNVEFMVIANVSMDNLIIWANCTTKCASRVYSVPN